VPDIDSIGLLTSLYTVLTWISIYWFSRAGPAASTRIYYEYRSALEENNSIGRAPVLTGLSYFPKDILNFPRTSVPTVIMNLHSGLNFTIIRWTKKLGKVVFTRTHEKGGHFAAHEVPDLLVNDLREFWGKGGPAFGVVPGQSGYD
jgi:hypothetical protein